LFCFQYADVPQQQVEAWREQTSASFFLKLLPGDHFFLRNEQAHLLATLSRQLRQLVLAPICSDSRRGRDI
jgi:surfactin synthase thioesterase subunit